MSLVATTPPATAGKPQFRFGHRLIAPDAVSGYRLSRHRHWDRGGSLAIMLAGAAGALIFAAGVIEHGWRTRFLLGAGVCALIALSALEDLFKARPTEHYRFGVRLTSGESLTYVSTDQAETVRLEAQLRQATPRGA
jgi:hypothetical protein